MESLKQRSAMYLLMLSFLSALALTRAMECVTSPDKPTSMICTNVTAYPTTAVNLTELSILRSGLAEMPDLSNYSQLLVVHLDDNRIDLITRNYSSVEYLSLASNRISALHLTTLAFPALEYLDLSHNPIEHITQDYFSARQFPRLKTLKLINAFKHINPYIIDERFVSFASLTRLSEIDFDDNHLDDFLCSTTTEHMQWSLPATLQKLSLRRNQLTAFDASCLAQSPNLTELDLHSNLLASLPSLNFTLPSLAKVHLDKNLLTHVPFEFLRSAPGLQDLDLSSNPMYLKEIKSQHRPIFPANLKVLQLNEITSELSCTLFDNLADLEQLHMANLTASQLKSCLFRPLHNLKTLNLSNHRVKTLDESAFRPLFAANSLNKVVITSRLVRCEACSLRWLLGILKRQNGTDVICLDQQENEVSYDALVFVACPSRRFLSITVTGALIFLALLLFIIVFIYIDKQRAFRFASFRPVYHMIPLRHAHDQDRIYQDTTEDLTNDNVMLVT